MVLRSDLGYGVCSFAYYGPKGESSRVSDVEFTIHGLAVYGCEALGDRGYDLQLSEYLSAL